MSSVLKKLSNFWRILNYQPSEDTNIQIYESTEVVDYYLNQLPALQLPELAILNRLKLGLDSFRMLDIGIGAGRTTHFFAPLVHHYTGVDYAESMVSACRGKFAGHSYEFSQADVRDLSRWRDGEFDLVLFSFNGLDSISPADREVALLEIRRVTKPGKFFVFSSHNLNSLREHVRYEYWPPTPATMRKNYRSFVLKKLNPPIAEMQHCDFARVVDGSHAYQIRNYWVKPNFQIATLQRLGFTVRAVIDLKGEDLTDDRLRLAKDTWLYYLCVRND
ncbi:MAG: class I SAM-dependent methyltransferase [Cyclobacteriaceae bacterium]|jgi:ubiquinone/menaquinone biosynthesis C-methylase UbiE